MNDNFKNIQKISICDVSDNMYTENLNIELSKEETESIISTFGSSEPKDKIVSCSLLYSLVLVNSENSNCQKLLVDSRHTVYTDINHSYERTDESVALLKQIETAHNIKSKLYNRTPSKNYFAFMEFSDHATFREKTNNNFIEGINISIPKESCLELKDILSECSFSETADYNINKKYSIDIYTAGGGIITTLFINDQSEFFTDNGYLIKSTALNDYLNNLLAENDVK